MLFDAEAHGIVRDFWLQIGLGVSSRLAEWTRHYQPADNHVNGKGEGKELGADGRTYLEERNILFGVAAFAKRALRRRLVGVLIKDGDDRDLELELLCVVGPELAGGQARCRGGRVSHSERYDDDLDGTLVFVGCWAQGEERLFRVRVVLSLLMVSLLTGDQVSVHRNPQDSAKMGSGLPFLWT